MEFSDIWAVKPKTAQSSGEYYNDYVPDEVEDAVKNFIKDHPFLGSSELSFKGEYDEDHGIEWEEDEKHGDFWVSPKEGFSFGDSGAAAPHISHEGDLLSMIADIASLKPCGMDCDASSCRSVDTSGHTEQSIQKVTEDLLQKHNVMSLIKANGLDLPPLSEERQRRIKLFQKWRDLDEAAE